jgi:predicted RNase H-like HicB family nuclease
MVGVKYRVQVERDESGAWNARVLDVPGYHTYGRTLQQLRGRVREALSLWVTDADTAELDFDVRLPAALRSRVRSVTAVRQKAARAQEEAQKGLASAARELTVKFGLSLRDAADLMGLSHQRVQQLVAGTRSGTSTGRRRRGSGAAAPRAAERATG